MLAGLFEYCLCLRTSNTILRLASMDILLRLIAVSGNPLVQHLPQKLRLEVLETHACSSLQFPTQLIPCTGLCFNVYLRF
jgi:hypothetical protein